ncbi:transposase [Kocuria rhizosphaericola]|uniref:transposase n=1 Tax=Kocuria rhizosphaericola TaxID=3376284 RepID=UPI0037A65DF2
MHHARLKQERRLVADIPTAFPSCPIPGIARVGRPLSRWRGVVPAYFDTAGASIGPTEAVNGVIETRRRVVRGFSNFENYRLRVLLTAGRHRPWRKAATHAHL